MKRQKWSLTRTAAILLFLLIAAASGCIDAIEDFKDYVKDPIGEQSIYVYEDIGEDGDPKNVISEEGLYAMATAESGGDEKTGIPMLRPVREYVIQTDLETEDIIIHDAQGNPVDLSDLPDKWKELIVKDEYGMPITDVDQLDLRINPIGKNRYEILNLAQEMQDPNGGIWKKIFYKEDDYMDEKLVDNVIGNKDAEITGGLILREDGNVYGIIIANEKQFEIYGGDFGIRVGGENEESIEKGMCHDTGRDLYMYIYNLSDLPEWNMLFGDGFVAQKGMEAYSPCEFFEEMNIARKIGRYASFYFVNVGDMASSPLVEIAHDDGEVDSQCSLGDDGQAVFFPNDGKLNICGVNICGARSGDTTRMFDVEIWDANLKTLHSVSHDYTDFFPDAYPPRMSNSDLKWVTISIPNIEVTGDFYVAIFTYSRFDSGIVIGRDSDTKSENSRIVDKNPNRILDWETSTSWNARQDNTDWMIRVLGK